MLKINDTHMILKKNITKSVSLNRTIKSEPIKNDILELTNTGVKSQSLFARLRSYFRGREILTPKSFHGCDLTFDNNKTRLSNESIAFSRHYINENIIYENEIIPTGFKDGGRASIINNKGVVSTAENDIAVVDKENDTYLKEAIEYAKNNTLGLSNKKKMKFLFNMVTELSGGDSKKVNYIYQNGSQKKEFLLGSLFNHETTNSKHKALMFKILSDEIGLKTRMIRGRKLQQDSKFSDHVWNEVILNKSKYVVDVDGNLIVSSNPDNPFKLIKLKDFSTLNGKFYY